MRRARPITVAVSIMFLVVLLLSCATVEKEKAEFQGVTGELLPVDEFGNEIVYLKKEKILINLVPIVDGKRLFDESFSFIPRSDGGFTRELGSGTYTVEVFLKGFYVRSFDITVNAGETVDLDVIKIEKIEAGLGAPVMGEENSDVILNGGDVNIEPPSL